MPNDYEEYFEYLDSLRESGVTNMFGAVPYLMATFDYLAEDEARDILFLWMATFNSRHKKADA